MPTQLIRGTIVQNRYEIIRLLGEGGFGAVYQARDVRLGQVIALKENIGGDPRQFQQEALILASLRHPNLPRVSDHFIEPNGAQYLVMDFVEGRDLKKVVQEREGALPEVQVLDWFDQILSAVAYMHSYAVIHRDIKPANIRIDPNGRAVLVDFGIAKVFQPGQPTMSGARAAGSAGFAAPEQYRGGTDQRSDIYSLGATLYALLTGCAPPDAQALESRAATLTPPRVMNSSLSVRSEQCILRAMAVQPGQRFQSAGEMRQALQRADVLEHVPLPNRLKTSPAILVISLLLFLVLASSAVGGILWWSNTVSGTPTTASLTTSNVIAAEPTRAPLLPTDVPGDALAPTSAVTALPTAAPTVTRILAVLPTEPRGATLSPPTQKPALPTMTPIGGGRGRIAFVSNRDGNEEIYVINADGSGLTRLTNSGALDIAPAWSPDGKRIAFVSNREGDHEIYVMGADGSGLIRLTRMPGLDNNPTWSPDGKRIAFESHRDGNDEIYVMGADGSGVSRLTNNGAIDMVPAWSPDGKRIAFVSKRDGNFEIYVMNADGSGVSRLTNTTANENTPAWSPDGTRIAFSSEAAGSYGIYVMSADGSGVTRLTGPAVLESVPAWSPDGKRIAYASYRGGNYAIYIMNVDGSAQTRLMSSQTSDYNPAWQP